MNDATLEKLAYQFAANEWKDSVEFNEASQAVIDLLTVKPDLTGWEIGRLIGGDVELSRLTIQGVLLKLMESKQVDTGEYLPTVPTMEWECRVA